MKKVFALGLVSVMFICSGCGGDSHESLTKEGMSTMKELVATLDGVKDEASAKAAKSKVQSLMTKMKELNERQTKLGIPTEAEVKAMDTKYGKEMEELQLKLAGNMMRITFDPKIRAQFDDIDTKIK